MKWAPAPNYMIYFMHLVVSRSFPNNAEAQVDRLFCFDHFRRFEMNMLAAQVVNQSRAAAK